SWLRLKTAAAGQTGPGSGRREAQGAVSLPAIIGEGSRPGQAKKARRIKGLCCFRIRPLTPISRPLEVRVVPRVDLDLRPRLDELRHHHLEPGLERGRLVRGRRRRAL